MIRRPPRSTLDRSSAASDVYKRQPVERAAVSEHRRDGAGADGRQHRGAQTRAADPVVCLLYTSPSPRDRTRSRMPSSAWKKKTKTNTTLNSHKYEQLIYDTNTTHTHQLM